MSSNGPFTCTLCSYKTKLKENLKVHIKSHKRKKPFKCPHPKCPFSTIYKSKLTRHGLVHSRKKKFKCSHCPKSFGEKGALKKHLGIHEGVKPFTCQLCPYKTRLKCDLKSHTWQHTEKPFKCSHPDCPFSATQTAHLAEHEKIHKGEKPHACALCPFKSARRHNLVKHLKTHTGEKPFRCQICDYSATQSETLNRHFARRHKSQVGDTSIPTSGHSVIHPRSQEEKRPHKCPQCALSFLQGTHLTIHMTWHALIKQ